MKDNRMDDQMDGRVGTLPGLGCRITLTKPGAKCRQEEATDEACKSPTLLSNVRANNRAILRIGNFSEADYKGSEGVPDNPSRTTERSQKGTRELQIGLSHLAPWRK